MNLLFSFLPAGTKQILLFSRHEFLKKQPICVSIVLSTCDAHMFSKPKALDLLVNLPVVWAHVAAFPPDQTKSTNSGRFIFTPHLPGVPRSSQQGIPVQNKAVDRRRHGKKTLKITFSSSAYTKPPSMLSPSPQQKPTFCSQTYGETLFLSNLFSPLSSKHTICPRGVMLRCTAELREYGSAFPRAALISLTLERTAELRSFTRSSWCDRSKSD